MKPLSEPDAQLVSAAALRWVCAAVQDERAAEDLAHAQPHEDFSRLIRSAKEATEARRQAQQDFLRLLHHGEVVVPIERAS